MEREAHRLRVAAAIVVGLAAVAAIVVIFALAGTSIVDADLSSADVVILLVPTAVLAAVTGAVVGWLWRFWWPTARVETSLAEAMAERDAALARLTDIEALVPTAEAAPAEDTVVSEEAAEAAAPEEASEEAPTEATPPSPPAQAAAPSTPAEEEVEEEDEEEQIEAAFAPDEIPEVDVDASTAAAQLGDRFASSASDIPDDLKLIRGIGPVIERLLRDLNITSFQQLGSLEAEEVGVLAKALDEFPDRIVRDDWVGQARNLHARTRRD